MDKRRRQSIKSQLQSSQCHIIGATFSQFKIISKAQSTKEDWIILQTEYEGTDTIRESIIQLLVTNFENLKMEEGKTIS